MGDEMSIMDAILMEGSNVKGGSGGGDGEHWCLSRWQMTSPLAVSNDKPWCNAA